MKDLNILLRAENNGNIVDHFYNIFLDVFNKGFYLQKKKM